VERESHQPEFDLTIKHRQNGKLSDQVATFTIQPRGCATAHLNNLPMNLGLLDRPLGVASSPSQTQFTQAAEQNKKLESRPISRVLFPPCGVRQSFL